MLIKTIEYTDYNGTPRKEAFLFNLTKSELMKMELGTSGGYAEKLQAIVDANEGPEIMRIFEEIILKAYGRKSEDGKRFEKSKAISEEFSQTAAYDQLLMELLTDSDKAANFINELIPEDLKQDISSIPAPPLK